VRSGARAGEVLRIPGDQATIGRSAEASLRFDPARDLEVSGLHAAVVRRGDRWYLKDLDSRNGTWLNGISITTEEPLASGARVRFGSGGPEVEIRIAGSVGHPTTPSAAPETVAKPNPARPGTPSDRIRVLTRRNRTLGGALVVAFVVVGAGLAAVGYAWTQHDAAFEQERVELRGRMDSLMAEGRRTVVALKGEVEGLANALSLSNEELSRLRSGLDSAERAGADEGELEDLRRRLQAATVALTRQQLAASLDFRSIEAANRNAVAVVYVELGPGVVSTATAFAVRPDGTLLTNRHVVRPETGGPQPTRIGVQFAGSPQVWPGRVVAISPEADLAMLKVDNVLGEVPTILGPNESADTLVPGTPVALLGFPLGGEPPSELGRATEGRPLPRPLLTAGVFEGRSDGLLEILGYGEEGASGSPVLDGSGRLVGVLFGGRNDGSRRTLLAVPVEEVTRFLGDPR